MRGSVFHLVLVVTLALISSTISSCVFALDINQARAKFNYQMLCQGCHTPDGSGKKDVPELKDFIGHFLASQAGREYLIQVPGSANSALSDKELAEVINWIILEMSGSSLPKSWQAYSEEEVGRYRQTPLFEVIEHRKKILLNLKKQ